MLAVRARLPKSEQTTLIPCPACSGSGRRLANSRVAEYRVVHCRWCDGSGSTPSMIVFLFRRWMQIRAYNVARGSCYDDG